MSIKILKIKPQAENLIADLISDKKLNQISTDLFIREKILILALFLSYDLISQYQKKLD